MKPFYFFFLLSCLLSGSFAAMAQEPIMKHYTIEDGLPSNMVYDIYPDSKGYLWFGTDKGVARYNGISFQKFGIKDGLPDNEVFLFKEDYEGRLWLATWNGKLCFFKNDTFYTEKNTPWLKIPEECTHIYRINIEQDSSVTIQFASPIYLLNIKSERVKAIPLKHIFKFLDSIPYPSFVPFLVEAKKDEHHYSLLSLLKRIRFDDKGNFISFSSHDYHRKLTGFLSDANATYEIYNDSAYDLSGQFIFRVDNLDGWRRYPFLKTDSIHFWGQRDGLHINNSLHLLDGYFVSAIAEDFQRNYWVGALKNGVYMLPLNFMKTFRYRNAYKNNIDHALVMGNQLYYVDKKGGIYRESDKGQIEVVYLPDKKYVFFEDPGNRLFAQGYAVLTTIGSMVLLEDINERLRVRDYISTDNSFIGNSSFKNILFNGLFWGVTAGSIAEYKLLQGRNYLPDSTLFNSVFKGGRISSSTQDEAGNIWFTHADRVFTVSNDSKLSLKFTHNYGLLRKMIVKSNFITAFTDANQLVIFNRNRVPAVIDTISRDDITWEEIIPIDNTHLLLSSDKTYFILTLYPDKKSGKAFELMPVENLFLPKQADYVYANKEYCYFFKNGDILKMATSVLLEKTPTPRVYFTRLTTPSQKLVLFQDLSFAYGEAKNIRLNFEALSFSSKMLSYQYSLSGDRQDNWQATEGTELNLLVPSYGDYTVKVRAKTISGDYSEPDIIRFTIRRPYWATWWCWSFVIIVIAGVTWWVVRLRTRRLLQRKQIEFEAERRYQQVEYKALNALMNPHFIFNSMNNIQGLINKDEKETANEYLVIFSDMIRQNMHNIDEGTISLHKELSLCRNYLELEKLRFRELVNYTIEVAEDLDTEDIFIPPLMIQPLIENAIRHGLLPKESPANMVHIRIFEQDNILFIEVEDNGIGLTKAAQNKSSLHQSVGLGNVRKRLAHIRKMEQKEILFDIEELTNPDGDVKGTLATINIHL